VVVCGRDGCVVGGGFDYVVVVGGGVGVGLIMDMVERGFLSLLLLAKDIASILQLRELRLFSVDMLSTSFSVLCDGLPSHDGFLFMSEPLYFLLNPGQLLFFCCGFILFGLLIPILYLDLVELSVTLNILY
jgi:hypothetical protein